MIKLATILTIWQPEIFAVMAQNLSFPDWIDAKVIAVVSPNDKHLTRNLDTCKKHGFDIVYSPNHPVGQKRNNGLIYALENYDFDYYFKIDSDDLLHPDYFGILKPYLKDGVQFIGMNQYCAYDTETKRSQIVTYKKVIGGGKLIHKNIVQRVFSKSGYLYPPDQDSGLDNTTQRNIKQVTNIDPVMLSGCWLLDIKSNENINHYRGLKWLPCSPVEYEYILENYGDIEAQLNEQKGQAQSVQRS